MTDRLEFKAALAVDEAGTITGTVWPFGSPDRVGDVIEKGAFTAPSSLPMLFADEQAQAIGVWDEIAEADQNLIVKGRLLVEDVERPCEVRAMTRAGAVSGLSIGFVTKTAKATPRAARSAPWTCMKSALLPSRPIRAQITCLKSNPLNKETIMDHEDPTIPAHAPLIDTKAFDDMKARLGKPKAKANPPGTPAIVQGAPDRKAFVSVLQGAEFDRKALTVAADAPAYVLAPQETSGEFIRNLGEFSPIRAIADVRTTVSQTILLPKRTGITIPVWVGKTTARTASEPTFGQSEIAVKELATHVDLSLRMLEDPGNVEAEVRLALTDRSRVALRGIFGK